MAAAVRTVSFFTKILRLSKSYRHLHYNQSSTGSAHRIKELELELRELKQVLSRPTICSAADIKNAYDKWAHLLR